MPRLASIQLEISESSKSVMDGLCKPGFVISKASNDAVGGGGLSSKLDKPRIVLALVVRRFVTGRIFRKFFSNSANMD